MEKQEALLAGTLLRTERLPPGHGAKGSLLWSVRAVISVQN